jgi:hypothetical protein
MKLKTKLIIVLCTGILLIGNIYAQDQSRQLKNITAFKYRVEGCLAGTAMAVLQFGRTPNPTVVAAFCNDLIKKLQLQEEMHEPKDI